MTNLLPTPKNAMIFAGIALLGIFLVNNTAIKGLFDKAS